MKQAKTHIGTMTAMLLLVFGTVANGGAEPGGNDVTKSGGTTTDRGTIEGEVKKIEPNVVIIQKESDGKDNGKEVQLSLHETTHKGDIKEGDKVEAFVTPGGTTTSVQPKKG